MLVAKCFEVLLALLVDSRTHGAYFVEKLFFFMIFTHILGIRGVAYVGVRYRDLRNCAPSFCNHWLLLLLQFSLELLRGYVVEVSIGVVSIHSPALVDVARKGRLGFLDAF